MDEQKEAISVIWNSEEIEEIEEECIVAQNVGICCNDKLNIYYTSFVCWVFIVFFSHPLEISKQCKRSRCHFR